MNAPNAASVRIPGQGPDEVVVDISSNTDIQKLYRGARFVSPVYFSDNTPIPGGFAIVMTTKQADRARKSPLTAWPKNPNGIAQPVPEPSTSTAEPTPSPQGMNGFHLPADETEAAPEEDLRTYPRHLRLSVVRRDLILVIATTGKKALTPTKMEQHEFKRVDRGDGTSWYLKSGLGLPCKEFMILANGTAPFIRISARW